jgi:hypothetical protein
MGLNSRFKMLTWIGFSGHYEGMFMVWKTEMEMPHTAADAPM